MTDSAAASSAPRVAYVIASHTLPEQVLRLASVLRRGSPGALLVLHHDERRCAIDRTSAQELGLRLLEPPSAANWGEISLLEMVLRCLRHCLQDTDFEWLVLLSGQDFPIRPLPEIERALAQAECDAFIETLPCPRPRLGSAADEFAGRYHFRWSRPRAGAAALAHAVARRGSLLRTRELPSGRWVGVRALRSPFDPRLACHHGADWFSLGRRAVETVDAFARSRPDVLRYYGRTLHPTESFIQTVLANDASVRLSGDCRRYTVWGAPHQASPRVLGIKDLQAMLDSGCDFARKFDQTVDGEVLDALERTVLPASERRGADVERGPIG